MTISHGRSFRARAPYIVRTYLWKRLNASVPACWSCSFTPAVQNTSFFQDNMILLNVQLTNVAVILEARVLHDVYDCSNLRSAVLRMGQNGPMGSTSLVSRLPSSLNASRSFDTVRFLLTFRSPDGSKTLPTSMCMGSRRRLDSILGRCVTTKKIGASLLKAGNQERVSFRVSRCSDGCQSYGTRYPATNMGCRLLCCVKVCVRVWSRGTSRDRWRVAEYGLVKGITGGGRG